MGAPSLANYAQGVGVVSGDNFNTFLQSGMLLAQLRLFQGAWNGQFIYLGGYTSTGDGGQGFFWWNGSSTATDNGVTVVVPYGTVGYGAWLRIGSGSSSGALRYISTGAADTASFLDSTIVWNSTTATAKTEVLPQASATAQGLTITVKDGARTSSQYYITVSSPSSTIDFGPSDLINENGLSRTYRSDGVANWVIV